MTSKGSKGFADEVNPNMLKAMLGFGLAWVAWQLHSPDFWIFGFIAAVSAAAGAWRGLLGLIGLFQLIVGFFWSQLKRFERKGGKAKSETLASDDDLRKGGLFK